MINFILNTIVGLAIMAIIALGIVGLLIIGHLLHPHIDAAWTLVTVVLIGGSWVIGMSIREDIFS